MKKLFLSTAILLLVTMQMQSQWFFGATVKGNGIMKKEIRKVGSYDKISVAGDFNVTLVHGKEGDLNIKIEENLLKYLITEVNDNKLTIRWKKGENISTRKGVHIVVPFTDIDEVNLFGSGDVLCDDVIKSAHFKTLLTGSGDIILNIDVKTVDAKITGSGNIELLGETTDINILVTGSGGVQSYKLDAKNADAKITGSGDIGVNVSDNLKAKITGSGDITYTGNPENQDFKITGSGDIEAK